jgi:signal transduction histidine kinase
LSATGRGGRLDCSVGCANGVFEVVVGNDGAHIPPEQIPYLFEPFVGKGRAGHGLGLWITYQIVGELGGEISVRSEPGWTVFQVQLPLAQPETEELSA